MALVRLVGGKRCGGDDESEGLILPLLQTSKTQVHDI